MVERKTMRPVTIRRVIEVCSIALNQKVDVTIVSNTLNLSLSRAKEIILEVERMKLLSRAENFWKANSNTKKILEHYRENRWRKIHEYFVANYQFYRDFIKILERHKNEEKGMSIDKIREEAVDNDINLNQTSLEVLADWCERLGVIQRHLYNGRLYLINRKGFCSEERFLSILLEIYHKNTARKWFRETFIEIPLVREEICERLKISRIFFDRTMRQIYFKNIGKIELSGAPIITHAKNSPLSEKKMSYEETNVLISPKFKLKKKREGLTIGRKCYYYLAIHEDF